jgi:DNA-binding Lrp family transcriptional regulator
MRAHNASRRAFGPAGATFKNPYRAGATPRGIVRMETLYLLIECEVGRLDEVMRRLRSIPTVAEVEAVTGPFDLIVKLQAERINEALDTVVNRVRKVPGIKGTETLVTVSGP